MTVNLICFSAEGSSVGSEEALLRGIELLVVHALLAAS